MAIHKIIGEDGTLIWTGDEGKNYYDEVIKELSQYDNDFTDEETHKLYEGILKDIKQVRHDSK